MTQIRRVVRTLGITAAEKVRPSATLGLKNDTLSSLVNGPGPSPGPGGRVYVKTDRKGIRIGDRGYLP